MSVRFHRVKVRQNVPTLAMRDPQFLFEIDGFKLRGVRKFTIEADCEELNLVTIEFFAEAFDLELSKLTDLQLGRGEALDGRELSTREDPGGTGDAPPPASDA